MESLNREIYIAESNRTDSTQHSNSGVVVAVVAIVAEAFPARFTSSSTTTNTLARTPTFTRNRFAAAPWDDDAFGIAGPTTATLLHFLTLSISTNTPELRARIKRE